MRWTQREDAFVTGCQRLGLPALATAHPQTIAPPTQAANRGQGIVHASDSAASASCGREILTIKPHTIAVRHPTAGMRWLADLPET